MRPGRLAGRRLADGDQPGRRARAARDRGLGGVRRARAGGVRRGAVPRPADRLRIAVGDARGRLSAERARGPRPGAALGQPSGGSQSGARELEAVELERGRDDAADQRPRAERPRGLQAPLGTIAWTTVAAARPSRRHPAAGRRSPHRPRSRSAARGRRRPTTARPRRRRADASATARRPPAGTGSRCRPAAHRRPRSPATSRRTSRPRDAPASRAARRARAPSSCVERQRGRDREPGRRRQADEPVLLARAPTAGARSPAGSGSRRRRTRR